MILLRQKAKGRGQKGFRSKIFSTTKILNIFVLFFTITLSSTSIFAQSITTGDPIELYLRFISEEKSERDGPSWNLRPIGSVESLGLMPDMHPWQNHPWFRQAHELSEPVPGLSFYSPQVTLTNNNHYPFGRYDGAMWQGVGSNYLMTAGIGYERGPIKAVLRPVITYSENEDFRLSRVPVHSGLHSLAMPLTFIDNPQRFGEEPFRRFDPGESYIRAEYGGWMAGVSNRRIWTGPAIHNPLILSNNAPGFIHGFVGTERPFDIRIGHLETYWFWGGLRESGYFDNNPDNNTRFISGLVLSYNPKWTPGLHVGITRVAYSAYTDGIGASDLFLALQRFPERPESFSDVDPADFHTGMFSIFYRWVFPEIGFEAYGEWGRNDYRRSFRDFISEPELNRAYTIGLLKRFHLPWNSRIVLNVEMTQLENSTISSQFRENNIWYTNEVIPQGFTNRGQVLGATIGPGSAEQSVRLTWYNRLGSIGASYGRTVYHNDRIFRHADYYQSIQLSIWNTIRKLHEVEMHYGLYLLAFLPYNLELQADFRFSSIENQYNIIDRDVKNRNMMFTLRYNLVGLRR